MTTVKPPCGKVCPDRTVTCKLTCEKWKVYEAAKREEYAQRKIAAESSVQWSAARARRADKGIMHKARRPIAYGKG